MKTKDEIINNYADEFLWHLMPFGSLDIMHLVRKAYELNIASEVLTDILYEQAEERNIKLFDEHFTTDLNALLNDYILSQARNDISQVLDIDLDDYDVYFFVNYLDDPLQYSNKLVEDIEQSIKEHEVTREDFDIYAQYILDEMGIEY